MSNEDAVGSTSSGGHFTEFIGVYDADATLWGELSYWIGARLGVRHCSLCEVTHGLFRRRSDWEACAVSLPAPFVAYHRNDAPSDVRETAAGSYPVVLGRHANGLTVLLTNDQIEACNGSPQVLVDALRTA